MARLDMRLRNEQKLHLDSLSAKTGVSSSEIIRTLIDECDEVTLSMALTTIEKRRKQDIEKVASMKYYNLLLSNLTKNVNQIAHYVNYYKDQSDNQKLVNSFEALINKIDEFEAEVLKRKKGSFEKEIKIDKASKEGD